MKKEFLLCGRKCVCYDSTEPSCVLIEPVDERDLMNLDNQVKLIETMSSKPFVLVAFAIDGWNRELSPWKAPAVFGKEDFGDGAGKTLAFIEDILIVHIRKLYGSLPVILGGYSLAGLFSLWASFNSSAFRAVTGVSASVWFPSWLEYALERECKASHVYLSLGDKEEKARNPMMATVGSCMRLMDEILSRKGIDHVLEWNEGNHFRDVDIRCAKGFAWALKRI